MRAPGVSYLNESGVPHICAEAALREIGAGEERSACRGSRRSSRAGRRPAPRRRRPWRAGTCGSGTHARSRAARRRRIERRRTGSRRWRPAYGSRRRSLEGVAVIDGAGRVTLAEPLLALRAGAVRERLLVHVALHAFLDGVVADRRRRRSALRRCRRLRPAGARCPRSVPRCRRSNRPAAPCAPAGHSPPLRTRAPARRAPCPSVPNKFCTWCPTSCAIT